MQKPFALQALFTRTTGFALAALLAVLCDSLQAADSHRIDAGTPAGLRDLFAHKSAPLPFLSAHRGGPGPGFPENCVATFENTLKHTTAIMEIDPRYTKDGQIVVHHDPTLERTSTGQGKVIDHTLAELRKLNLKDTDGKVTGFRMSTLDEMLAWARGKTVLVLDQKDVPAAVRARKVTEHKAESCAMLIVNSFKDAQEVYAVNTNIMMEVMIPNLEKARQFAALGIPWRNVVAFVGHTPPEDAALYAFIHSKGASCMIGTSRNLDRKVIKGEVENIQMLDADYRAFLKRGADIIETDIPTKLGPMLLGPTKSRTKQ